MSERASVEFVGHATALLEVAGVRVITDPVLRRRVGPLIRVGNAVRADVHRDVDVVLISHAHHDHLDLPSLRRIGCGIPIVAARGVDAFLRTRGFGHVVGLAPGESIQAAGLSITATPAVHGGRRLPGRRGEAVGYVVSSARERVYFAGDTDLFDAMRELGDLDVALVPVWGWGPSLGPGHLDPHGAAEAVARLRPRRAIPVHWGSYRPIGAARVMSRHLHEPPLAFAAQVEARRLPTRVDVLLPGERMAAI